MLLFGLVYKSLASILAKTFVSCLMVFLAFFPKGKKEFIKELLSFYLVSFLFGGLSLMLSSWLPSFSSFILCIIGGVGLLFWKIGVRFYQKEKQKQIFEGEITIGENKKKIKLFYDTGNSLVDFVTKKPVMILEKSVLDEMKVKQITAYKPRWIPFQSIGNQAGMLLTIELTLLEIYEKDFKQRKVLAGIYEGKLDKQGKYQALIGPRTTRKERRKWIYWRFFKRK